MKLYVLLLLSMFFITCSTLETTSPIDPDSDTFTVGNNLDTDGNGIADYYDKIADSDGDGIANIDDEDSPWYDETVEVVDIVENPSTDTIDKADTTDLTESKDSSEVSDTTESKDTTDISDDTTITEPVDTTDVDTTETNDTTNMVEDRPLYTYTDSLPFNTSSALASLPYNEAFNSSAGYTILVWITIDESNTDGSTIIERTWSGSLPIRISLSGNQVTVGKYISNTWSESIKSAPLTNNTWYLIAMSCSTTGSTLSVFNNNGKVVSSNESTLTFLDGSSAGYAIGYYSYDKTLKFVGAMNGISILSEPLTNVEIVSAVKDGINNYPSIEAYLSAE